MGKAESRGRIGAIVLAAGKGKRMQSTVRKQFLLLGGKPLIYYALRAFEESPADDIILVTGEEEIAYCRSEIAEKYGFSKIRAVIAGGEERYHSVYAGLSYLEQECGYGENCRVLIHDGARPFVTGEIISRVLRDTALCGASVAAMKSKDTVKLSDEKDFAAATPDRSTVWTVQTPQGFSFPLIREAYDRMMRDPALQKGITDDAMVAEKMMGCPVKLTEGSYRNIKVTTPEDMLIAEAFLAEKNN